MSRLEQESHVATVAKRFSWESAHRLPKHEGACRNLHGHSYTMTVELEGPVGEDGIAMDFQDIKGLVKPLVDAWDHSTLVAEYDTELLAALDSLGSRFVVLPSDSTAENLAGLAADYVVREGDDVLRDRGITRIRVRVAETETCFAEVIRVVPSDDK